MKKRPSQRQPVVFFPTREETNERQINSLLSIMRELQSYILEPTTELGATARAMNGEAALAAQTTFIKMCARLDAITEDTARFTLAARDKLMDEITKTQTAQQKFIDAQRASSEQMQRPSFLLKPTLATFGSDYVAWWGDIKEPGKAIIGRGKTPNAAIADFDRAFDRTPEEQVIIVATAEGEKDSGDKT